MLPDFFFHLSIAHAILRHLGAKIGKRDYLGNLTQQSGGDERRERARCTARLRPSKTEEQVQMMPTVSELRNVTGELSMVRLAGGVATAAAPRFYKGREMNKEIMKQTMLSLEARDLESAREKYLEYVGSARLDRSEPIEDDEQAQAELASDLSEAFDDTVHSHSDKIEKLSAMDFGPKSKVEEGAVVKLGGRFFVIAVSTGKFVCDGNEIMGISTQAPIYAELEGKRAGDAISFNGTELVIEEVA